MNRVILTGLLAAAVAVVPTITTPTASAAPAQDLIISEYVEGSSNNKVIELYNGTGATVDLSTYSLELYANGNTTRNNRLELSGSLADGQTFVIANSQAALGGVTVDLHSSVTNFNGDDALVLLRDGDIIDSFGQVGTRANFGTDVTLVRRPTVTAGGSNSTDVFDATAEWITYPKDTFTYLGTHEMTDSVPVTPEPTTEPSVEPTAEPTTEPTAEPTTEPTTEPTECSVDATRIGQVQGAGTASAMTGQTVSVQGIVVGDFQDGGFNGYYLQDGGDDDAATSDGIFIYDNRRLSGEVNVGDQLRITGTVSEYFEMTQITAASVIDCGTAELPAPTMINFPNTGFERYESMLVEFAQPLTILELYQFGRYGQIAVGPERQFQPTAIVAPDAPEALTMLGQNRANRVLIDDGRSTQNPTPAIHPATGEPLTRDTLFRAGDRITGVAGVLDYRFSNWALQPTIPGTIEHVNPRPQVPQVGGELQVASFNVLNYFTTLGSRGARTEEEFTRQEAKTVAAINALDAQIVALNEIENNGTAVQTLVAALNEAAGGTRWAALNTGTIGTDEITTALIYQPEFVEPVGAWDTLTSADDPRFDTTKNRPTLAQTFLHKATDSRLTVAANHLKSKGSACSDPSEATMSDLVGNCNETRTAATEAMIDWLTGDTISVDHTEHILVVGDLNSYDHEAPIQRFLDAGFVDLAKRFQGEEAYSCVFDGQLGYLDYALASPALDAKVVGAADWHINSDELPLIDYSTQFKQANEIALTSPDEFRSSDHDPVVVGIQFTPSPEPSPDPSVEPTPDSSVEPTPDSSVEPTPPPTVESPAPSPTVPSDSRSPGPDVRPSVPAQGQPGNTAGPGKATPRPGLPRTGANSTHSWNHATTNYGVVPLPAARGVRSHS